MITTLRQGMATLFIAVATITLLSAPARADVATDLQALNTQATALQSYLEGVQLNADSTPLCGPLVQADNMARDMVNSITAVDESLAAPLQLDTDVLGGIEGLSNTTLSLANEALRLSVDLQSLSTAVDMITLKDALAAMLQLSTDIGSMADRIGEMADNILVMSDNIGLMADRILLTQELQNRNVELTINSILQTQTNTLALVSVVEDSTYELDFARLISEGELLGIELPNTMPLEITECAPAMKAASSSARTKPATLTTGLVVQVPEYLTPGEVIKINTETREFISRA